MSNKSHIFGYLLGLLIFVIGIPALMWLVSGHPWPYAPDSFLGKFWRWHINFCPGRKGYFTSLSEEQKIELRKKYNFTKYQ